MLGTCKWFTSHALFSQWNLETDGQHSRLLYVTADPGCGKSVLSRYLIDQVLPRPQRAICYFFFKDDFDDQKSALRAVCTLLHQLLDVNRRLVTASILDTFSSRKEKLFESFSELWDMFVKATSHQETICVLDALDECQDQERKQLISAIASAKAHSLKFLLTSRPYEYIRTGIARWLKSPMTSIHIQGDQGDTADAIMQEIQLVLSSRIDETAELFSLEADELDLMRQQLGSVPNRTYLWITLLFDGLMNKKLGISKADILDLSKKAPQSVYDAYEKILDKSPDHGEARRLLCIILGARQILSLADLSFCMVCKDNRTSSQMQERLVPKTRIKSYLRTLCGLFIVIVDDKVYLLHQTAREFLIRDDTPAVFYVSETSKNQRNSFEVKGTSSIAAYAWQQSFIETDTNAVLAEICILYLREKIAKLHKSFLNYCAAYWTSHYSQSAEYFQLKWTDAALDLCANDELRSQWTRWYKVDIVPQSGPTLHLASALGLGKVVKMLLATGDIGRVDVDSKDSEHGQTPLSWAAENGHEAVVRLLDTLTTTAC